MKKNEEKKQKNLFLSFTSIISIFIIIGGAILISNLIHNHLETTKTLVTEQQTPDEDTSNPNDSVTDKTESESSNSNEKTLYLTFDDGPSDYTKLIVDILNEYDIKGTFYFIGKNISGREESVKYAAENGHTIGLHSMTHNKDNMYKEEDPFAFVNELYEVQTLLEPLIGYKTFATRAPYGSNHMPLQSFEKAGEAGFKLWDWSIDTNDWQEGATPESIMQFLQTYPAEKREILLEHELPVTIEVLPQIIEFFKNQGYEFKPYQTETHFSYNFFRDKRY